MLQLANLRSGYDRSDVLHDVSLKVEPGSIVAIIGANGAGKSTLIKTISGLLPARSGSVTLEGQDITALSTGARVALGVAHVPEGRRVFPTLSATMNLEMGAYSARLDSEEKKARIEKAYAMFPDLAERRTTPAGNFSGGQQQMLAIGRGLMSNPRYLLLDEPSLGLSPVMVSRIFSIIADLRGQGLAILLSEQNARMSLKIADYAYVMESGKIVVEGTGSDLLARSDIAQRYLGVGEEGARHDDRVTSLVGKLAGIIATGA